MHTIVTGGAIHFSCGRFATLADRSSYAVPRAHTELKMWNRFCRIKNSCSRLYAITNRMRKRRRNVWGSFLKSLLGASSSHYRTRATARRARRGRPRLNSLRNVEQHGANLEICDPSGCEKRKGARHDSRARACSCLRNINGDRTSQLIVPTIRRSSAPHRHGCADTT